MTTTARRTDDNARVQYIDADTLDYLIDVAKPRSIEYERATIRKLFAIRHKKPWTCGSAKSDIGCHIRMCRRMIRERNELITERLRRESQIDDDYRQAAGGRY